jgi:hypothetical protein
MQRFFFTVANFFLIVAANITGSFPVDRPERGNKQLPFFPVRPFFGACEHTAAGGTLSSAAISAP